jgi:hypothetical protein
MSRTIWGTIEVSESETRSQTRIVRMSETLSRTVIGRETGRISDRMSENPFRATQSQSRTSAQSPIPWSIPDDWNGQTLLIPDISAGLVVLFFEGFVSNCGRHSLSCEDQDEMMIERATVEEFYSIGYQRMDHDFVWRRIWGKCEIEMEEDCWDKVNWRNLYLFWGLNTVKKQDFWGRTVLRWGETWRRVLEMLLKIFFWIYWKNVWWTSSLPFLYRRSNNVVKDEISMSQILNEEGEELRKIKCKSESWARFASQFSFDDVGPALWENCDLSARSYFPWKFFRILETGISWSIND